MRHWTILLAAILLAAGLVPCNAESESGPTASELKAAGQGDEWLLPNRDYAGQRFADQRQITPQNAGQLRPVCIYQVGDLRPFQTNPLVYVGVMYVTTPSSTIALDPTTCAVRWRHDWQPKAKNAEVKNLGEAVVNPYRSRGAALKDGKLVRSTSDGYLIALDLDTGKPVWERHVADAEKYELMIMASLVFEDLVITATGISEYGVKGWIGGFRLADGEPVWRFNTVPGEREAGSDTWGRTDEAPRGGGGIWVTPSLDAEKGLLYAAVGNPAPDFYGDVRSGSNLYTDSMIVLDARSGKLQWYRQFVPHDLHDWDLTDDARQSRGRADDRGGAHLSRCARRLSVELAVLQSQPRYARRPDSGLVWRLPEGRRTALYTGAEIHGRIVHLRPARQIARLADGGERGDWRDPVEIPFAAADGDVGDDDLSRPGVYRRADRRLCRVRRA